MGFWLQLGVSRLPHGRDAVRDRDARAPTSSTSSTTRCCARCASSCSGARGDAIILAEANVDAGRDMQLLRRRRRPAADDVQLPGQPAPVLRARHRRRAAAARRRSSRRASVRRPRSGRTSCATTTSSTSAGSTDEQRQQRVRGDGPDEDDAALRPRHPAPAGADARRRSPPARARLQPAVHAAGHAGDPLRRRARHGRRPAAARSATARARRCSGRPSRTAASRAPTSRCCR